MSLMQIFDLTMSLSFLEISSLISLIFVFSEIIELFGFATETELARFKLLITVSGVGPKAAMAILSHLTPEKFALAVCTDDKKTITKANGIGPKTAARVILELKDKLMKENPAAASSAPFSADAQDELTVNFVSKYQELHGEIPNQFAADAYDCVYAIYEALKATGAKPTMTASELGDLLSKKFAGDFTFDGLTGEGMTWDETGAVSKSPKGMVIENGVYVTAA